MSHSVYPMTREPHPSYRESGLTKVLALLLLLVAGALVFMVWQQKKQQQQPQIVNYEPKPISQRPDKLGAAEQTTIDVFEKFSGAVVNVTSIHTARNRITLDVTEIPQGTGSGFIWDQQGHVVTNYHVVQGGEKASVTLNDGTSYPATIVGVAPDKDIAVLHIDAPAQKLIKLPIGESANLKVGMQVLAIGNPFGLDQTLTTGVISGLGREIKSMSGRPISDVIQTDASINPGNSGGPLIDLQGDVVGINTLVAGQAEPGVKAQGIGFAISIATAKPIADQLVATGHVTHPYIGVQQIPLNPLIANRLGTSGKKRGRCSAAMMRTPRP